MQGTDWEAARRLTRDWLKHEGTTAARLAGRANVLIVPDLEAGNMLAKSLSFLAGADAAGIVLGAKVPIILTSRADSVMTRMASCAVAGLVAKYRREQMGKAVS